MLKVNYFYTISLFLAFLISCKKENKIESNNIDSIKYYSQAQEFPVNLKITIPYLEDILVEDFDNLPDNIPTITYNLSVLSFDPLIIESTDELDVYNTFDMGNQGYVVYPAGTDTSGLHNDTSTSTYRLPCPGGYKFEKIFFNFIGELCVRYKCVEAGGVILLVVV